MEKKILTYGFDKDSKRYADIVEIANKFNIEIANVEEEKLLEKVGFLMGIEGYESSKDKSEERKDIEFLLFSDFDRKDLSDYLIALRDAGINVPHKSVITEMTKDWTFKELLEHIEVEHRVMEKFNLLGTYVKKGREILEKEENKALELAIEGALELTKMKDIAEKDVDERFEKFKGLL